MAKINQPSFRTARLFADTDNDNPEKEPLISSSDSCDSNKSFDLWDQQPVPPTYFLYDSEVSDVETNTSAAITHSRTNNDITKYRENKNDIIQKYTERNNHYSYNIRRPQFQRETSNNIFNCSKKYLHYSTIVPSSESDLYVTLSPTDSTTRLYCPIASMLNEEETKLKRPSLTKRSNSFGEKNSLRSSYRSNEESPIGGRKQQSSFVTIFSVWNTMVGTSLLAMPWGIERSGLPTGLVIAIVMGAICLYTAYCNIDAQKQHGSPDGEIFELCNQLLGPWAEIIAKVFSYVVLLGAVIVYWILMSNFLNFTVDYLHTLIYKELADGSNGFLDSTVLCPSLKSSSGPVTKSSTIMPTATNSVLNNSSDLLTSTILASTVTSGSHIDGFAKYWNLKTVPIFLTVIVGPLLCFRSATFFTKFTSLGTLSVMYIILFVFIKAVNWGFVNVNVTNVTDIHYMKLFNSAFGAMCGMLSLSYFIHNIIISIMKTNKNQENNARDLSIAYILVIFTYSFIGVTFYVSFPVHKVCIEDNLLNNFKVSDPLTVIARVFLLFQLVTVYPLLAFLLRSQVLSQLTGSSNPSYPILMAFNVVLIITCVLFAIFVPRIGTVIRFTGAISGFVHVFTLPCLLRIASLKKQGELTAFSLIINILIPVLGAVNILMQFFVKDK